MTKPEIIDTEMHGQPGLTGAFLVRGDKTALVECGPKSSVSRVIGGLDHAGIEALDFILVTHIHLDHAGAAGTLAQRFPEATVVVHPKGAPHLIDPGKLWRSAARIYGDDMDRLWGGIDPLARERIHTLEDGQSVDLGGRTLRAIETPGHARHHHAFLDDLTGIVFTGDALGVRLPDIGSFRPATPPPEFDLVQAIASIERIRRTGAAGLWLTHYGPQDGGARPCSADEACNQAAASLEAWAGWVRSAREQTQDLDEAATIVKGHAEASMDSELTRQEIDRMEQTTSYRMNTWGYMRYLDKAESPRGAA
jgi:glyoxylase-like metal-dependent hydrolase (beta-lactamase superfamily II)